MTLFILSLLSMFTSSYCKDGISFVLVGDFGYVGNITAAIEVFNQINKMKLYAEKDSAEDFDFFVTVGDNLYPKDSGEPTFDEF